MIYHLILNKTKNTKSISRFYLNSFIVSDRLHSHDMDIRGKKEVLKSRLKMYYKRKKLSTANLKDPNEINYNFNYLVIIDFEATCDIGQPNSFRLVALFIIV